MSIYDTLHLNEFLLAQLIDDTLNNAQRDQQTRSASLVF